MYTWHTHNTCTRAHFHMRMRIELALLTEKQLYLDWYRLVFFLSFLSNKNHLTGGNDNEIGRFLIGRVIHQKIWDVEQDRQNVPQPNHGQSKWNMVFNLFPLHDIVPNAETFLFHKMNILIYSFIIRYESVKIFVGVTCNIIVIYVIVILIVIVVITLPLSHRRHNHNVSSSSLHLSPPIIVIIIYAHWNHVRHCRWRFDVVVKNLHRYWSPFLPMTVSSLLLFTAITNFKWTML